MSSNASWLLKRNRVVVGAWSQSYSYYNGSETRYVVTFYLISCGSTADYSASVGVTIDTNINYPIPRPSQCGVYMTRSGKCFMFYDTGQTGNERGIRSRQTKRLVPNIPSPVNFDEKYFVRVR